MANPLWAPDFTFSASCSLQPAQALGLQQQLYSQRASTQVCGEAENRAATAPLAGNKAEFLAGIPALPLSSCVTLGKPPNPSGPHCPPGSMGTVRKVLSLYQLRA